jgi:probable F420-dependent oxidoreductase
MTDRKFRFGISVRGDDLASLREFARKAEDLGYSTLFIPDHFGRQMAPLIALTAAAQATSRIRLGTSVLDNDFRHPVMLAKEAATLDLLSEGRLELGIGTGSQPRDNEMSGIPLDPPGVRVERIRETLRILKAFYTEETVNFSGKHYQVHDLPGYPKPVQKPHMPIFIGARGERMLRLAAREANIIGVMGAADEMEGRMKVVRDAAGDGYGDLEFNMLAMRVQVDGKPDSTVPGYDGIPGLTGSRDQVAEQLLKQREQYDISYVIVIGTAIDAFAPVVARLAGT